LLDSHYIGFNKKGMELIFYHVLLSHIRGKLEQV